MSEFKCEVVRVSIIPHPNADAIEIAKVGDYQSIVKKGQFKDGDLGVYIPEQAVLHRDLLKQMGMWDEFKGKGVLAGTLGNRVKAIKLRGVLSQGIMFPLILDNYYEGDNGLTPCISVTHATEEDGSVIDPVEQHINGVVLGEDVSVSLGITKYEPPVPSHMAGRVVGVDFGATHSYDFDNLKKMPTMFDDGETVVITEKIHGTLMCVSVVPTSESNEKYYGGRVIITSKGMGAKGLILDHNDETNLYAQAAKKHNLLDRMLAVCGGIADVANKPVLLFGEVFGRTLGGTEVQDLTYTDGAIEYRAFDICVGNRGSEKYLQWNAFRELCGAIGVQTVPVLYVGPYIKDVVLEHTNGPTTLIPPRGKMAHIREGVVVKSVDEDRNPHFGRKIAKSVSEAYLLRKNSTEFN